MQMVIFAKYTAGGGGRGAVGEVDTHLVCSRLLYYIVSHPLFAKTFRFCLLVVPSACFRYPQGVCKGPPACSFFKERGGLGDTVEGVGIEPTFHTSEVRVLPFRRPAHVMGAAGYGPLAAASTSKISRHESSPTSRPDLPLPGSTSVSVSTYRMVASVDQDRG
jgi:hypothetical protein